jgi:hypothetical protein
VLCTLLLAFLCISLRSLRLGDEKSFAPFEAIRHFRRSGKSLPYSRRITANAAALHRPTAAQTAAKFATRRTSPGDPLHFLAHLGGNFAKFANFNANRNVDAIIKTCFYLLTRS